MRAYIHRARGLAPANEARSLPAWELARGVAVLGLLELNGALIDRFAPAHQPWWDPREFPWVSDLERAVPQIRAELDTYLSLTSPPETATVIGARPIGQDDEASVPSGSGRWRLILLESFGQQVGPTAARFPATMRALQNVPSRGNIGFSCLDPDSRIDEHRDPNPGVLRYQLPIVVPGHRGDCAIRVSGQEVAWVEGRSVLFDLSAPHEAWNRSAAVRVVLVMEVLRPLPAFLSPINRLAQRAYRHLPSFRGMVDRANDLAERATDDASAA